MPVHLFHTLFFFHMIIYNNIVHINQEMYSIIHLPTNTLYSVQNNKKHSVLFFKKYNTAKYVADSLSTYNWIYNSFPDNNDEIFLMKQYQKKREALESKLWIKNTQLTIKNVQDFATRNVDIFYINNINWIDDENYNVDGTNIELTSSFELTQVSLENDYQMLIQ